MQLRPDDAAKLAGDLLNLETSYGADPDSGLVGVAASAQPGATPPGRLGNYRVTRLVGSGGMGDVYEAEQESPRRRVALKVVRSHLLSPELRRRFEHEVRILGSLQHPGIAQIYEAGQFGDVGNPGDTRPYFAMEYVEGEPLTKYAFARKLPVRARLELFLRVCQAVEHAHQRGIIHRDLKPGNILVAAPSLGDSSSGLTDQLGQPKVLDFGVARATDADITVTSVHTEVGKLVGTLPYMSPEQASGDATDLDTRSDVYALGVVLYELLSGKLPYEVKGDGGARVAEALRVIKEVDPAPLSSIDRVFRGDLETIVGKALEKERDRRYQSVGELAGDVRRYLADEPIVARRAGAWYELRKFARRNRGAIVGAAALALMLGASSAVSIAFGLSERSARRDADRLRDSEAEQRKLAEMHAADAASEERRAVREMETAQSIREYLCDVLLAVDPALPHSKEVTLREVLDYSSSTIAEELSDQPVARAAVEAVIGEAYRRVEQPRRAAEFIERALAVQMAELGATHEDTCSTRHNRAVVLWDMERREEAMEAINGVIADRAAAHGESARGTLASRHMRATFLEQMGKYTEAEEEYRGVLAQRRQTLGNDDAATLTTLMRLGGLLAKRGRHEEALTLQEEAFAMFSQGLGPDAMKTLEAGEILARLLRDTGRTAEAVTLLEDNLERREKRFGADSINALIAASTLATCLMDQGKWEGAESILRRVAQGREAQLGANHLSTAAAYGSLAVALCETKKLDEAEAALARAAAAQRAQLAPGHRNLLSTLNSMADVLRMRGKVDEAIKLSEEVVSQARTSESVNPALRARFMGIHARCLMDAKRYQEAEGILLGVHRYFASSKESRLAKQVATKEVIRLYRDWGKAEETAEWQRKLEEQIKE